MNNTIDTNFDFSSEISPTSDPDRSSPTLRKYHKILWDKPLPSGEAFTLTDTYPKSYLSHQSHLGSFILTSDAITHSYRNTKRMAQIISQLPPKIVNDIYEKGCTIGSYIIFPKNKFKGQQSINQARGCSHKIADRFDLTLECIRQFYNNTENPLTNVLKRHSDFFKLFQDFRGYVDFFLLQDLVSTDYSKIKYHLTHHSFEEPPLPQSVGEYLNYRDRTLQFINLRNRRIHSHINT